MRWIPLALAALLAMAVLMLATLAAITAFVWPNLPSLEVLTDYQPQIPLRVFSADGELIGEFGEERRDYVRIGDVPPVLTHAILAAEDERFYEHPGVDLIGLARATLANITSGGKKEGASTITMQVARAFFLSREKTYARKFYEILLSLKIEKNLSKDQILEIYINQIYLGQRAYGFSAAARTYFGKELKALTAGEAAMLAGLPKAPSAYNPVTNPKRAAQRQQYVLRRMRETAFLDDAGYRAALDTPLQLAMDPQRKSFPPEAQYVAEMARRIAVEQFGEDAYKLGLRVTTTILAGEQRAAYQALRKGVMDYDRRHGYRGAEGHLDLEGVAPSALEERIDELMGDVHDYDDLLAAVVLDAAPGKVLLYRNGERLSLTGDAVKIAAPMLGEKAPPAKRLRRGAIVRIRQIADRKYELTQLPEVEGALMSLDPRTGAIHALVGGFEFDINKFNHATQSLRQPGSSFKPFIYSAALEKGYGPASVLDDSPLSYAAGVTGSQAWEPKNYDDKYDGPLPLREALARSKNMIAIRLLESITPAYAQDYIKRFGFDAANHPPYLTMALGAGGASPWEMAQAYAVFANGGYRIQPHVVKEIVNDQGQVVARIDPPVAGESAARVIDPRNAFLMDSMMQDVVRRGTARRALSLKRNDLAGKTGTTNDSVDAWFCGYSPQLVAVSWLGFDQPRNLGRGETGGSAALPMWIDYMQVALKNRPETPREVPAGLLRINPAGGSGEDFIYAENLPPPPPPQAEPPHTLDSLFERLSSPAPTAPAQPQQAPAPVEERSPVPLSR